jgi:hypothetical protein
MLSKAKANPERRPPRIGTQGWIFSWPVSDRSSPPSFKWVIVLLLGLADIVLM